MDANARLRCVSSVGVPPTKARVIGAGRLAVDLQTCRRHRATTARRACCAGSRCTPRVSVCSRPSSASCACLVFSLRLSLAFRPRRPGPLIASCIWSCGPVGPSREPPSVERVRERREREARHAGGRSEKGGRGRGP
eukprot:scaffold8780_cov130-Isochrysis_galbana.AAC.4